MKGRLPALILIVLALTGFVWGVLQIFDMRFTRGDIYPPYSSLRADPLGGQILFESLARTGGLDVLRNENEAEEFVLPETATLFYLGAHTLVLTDKELADLESFIKGGGRFVLTFFPRAVDSDQSTPTPTPTPTPSPKDGEEEAPVMKLFLFRDLEKRWELHLTKPKEFEAGDATSKLPALEPAVPWHSASYFEKTGPDWNPVYSIDQRPVLIERSLGKGTIVLATDSYFLSNEAMRKDRRPALLSWLVGDKRKVVFDEIHLGVRQVVGVSTLIRRYRLSGVVGALLVLLILIAWKNVVSLVPASAAGPAGDEVVSGKESFAGLTSLFRRNIAPSELAEVCYSEWSKSLPRAARSVQLMADPVRSVMENFRNENKTHRNPVEIYQEISRVVGEKKWKRSK